MRARGLLVAAAALALAASGCGTDSPARRPADSPDDKTSLGDAQLDGLRAAMPTKTDFPDGWKVQTQSTPLAVLPGFSGTNTQISSVTPSQCLDFVASFVSAPGSSIPGEFIASVSAQTPGAGTRTVTVIAVRKARNWENPAKIRDNLRDCAAVTADLAFSGTASTATFTSTPIDASAIKGDAAGRTTLIRAGGETASISVVSAQTREVLIVATDQIGSDPDDDPKALLVKLINQTVSKIDAL
ncbi:hypothetical protein [Segniliparus rugosus]|uniref:PknH-like extracellular domain-containing protein n=1 Tax=Segniliparus rugosus (strain ATCC BAA-974 / DSM 45345 / CCUG 50838 / CIP 108380 / JCM 13579 / CDC 945) TaxID=679197 RepID=E5XLA0_SEGRC|nr:hypothetical protein [Segniliparus rugosus]EFV14886.1 hypothetical protein HMPREF9336_00269 [Segniliparus rugosus ATCC BAA-974]